MLQMNCGSGEDSWESFGLQGEYTSNPKEKQPWIFTRRVDAEAEAPILRSPDMKSRLTGKDLNAGKNWAQKKRVTENETVGWHHQLNGHEFEQTPGDSEGQRSLACCSPCDCRVRHDWVTEQQQPNTRWSWNNSTFRWSKKLRALILRGLIRYGDLLSCLIALCVCHTDTQIKSPNQRWN